MLKRFRSKRAQQKEPTSDFGKEVSRSSESDITLRPSSELLSVPSAVNSVSHSRSPSPSTSEFGLHIIHQPEHAVLDIIFVHGLGGHSRKTWSKDHDSSFFWPGLWLPSETDIGSARISTFGYNADWRSATKSISNVTDFAKELLFEMRFGKDGSGEDLNLGVNPIIFVVHSMGGLVVKKAYLLGLHDANYQQAVKGVSAIIFLSTPHRGTNLAKILNRVLAASFKSTKYFISDLSKSSSAIEELNEEFRHVAPNLSIWSFYETLATSIGPWKMMVLGKDSSVLGYPAEISRPLQADHHDVCKFSSPVDPNYVAVRNAITSLATQFRDRKSETKTKAPNPTILADEYSDIQDLFCNVPSTETDYDAIRRSWITDTCEWLLDENEFISWLNSSSLNPAVLWYTAPPATGKSVLSTFIIDHLRRKDLPCQYFLFKYSDIAKSMVVNCIKSLAFQLSRSQPEFRRLLASSSRESLGFDSSDPFLIWKRVMEGILLESNLTEPIYWVIDALDECDSPKIFLDCIQSFAHRLPVRILIFSRNTDSISTSFNRLSRSISISRIEKSTGHNQRDIERLAQMELDNMRGSSEFRHQLLQDIMERSEGNFLWVKLVLEEVMGCHTEEKIREVLDDIPSDMTLMFRRMEKHMLQSIRQSDMPLIKALIEWSTCAQRPLSLNELSQALQPEFSGFLDLKRTVQETCGQFVQVDEYDKVTLLHHTTREYFTQSSESEFRIDSQKAHKNLFTRTLSLFEDKDLQWRLLQNQHAMQSSEPFLFYSAVNWPFHLSRSTFSSSESLDALVKVFRGPGVLTWIHVLALLRRLEVVVEASKVLATLVDSVKQCKESTDPIADRSADLELLSEWAVDITKLMGRFASYIVASPGVLYYTIPPVCPPRAIMHKQFHKTANIRVSRLADAGWDDNLCRLYLPSEVQAWRMTCVGKYLAVLDKNGSVYIWDASNYSEISVIHHGEPVVAFAMNGNGGKLCTYGLKRTKLWSTLSGELLSSAANPPRIKARAVVFADNDRKLLMGGDDNAIRHIPCDRFRQGWQLLNRDLLDDRAQIDGAIISSPVDVVFNGDRTQVAVSYRGAPLSVWGLRDGRCINRCKRANSMRIDQRRPWCAVDRFTWNPVTGHILGIYRALSVFKWHPMTDEHVETRWTADEIAASPNGRLFATSCTDGSIRIWDFANFGVIYQLSSDSLVTEIAFSPDSRRFYDIRGGSINTWEPNSLTRFLDIDKHIDGSKIEDQALAAVPKISEKFVEQFEGVAAFSLATDGSSYCVGCEDGSVEHYQRDATQGKRLTRFNNYMPVTHIRWSRDGRLVALADLAGTIQVWKVGQGFEESASSSALPPPRLGDYGNYGNVEEMIFSLDNKYILIASTAERVLVYTTEDGKFVTKSDIAIGRQEKWLCHPNKSDIVLRCSFHHIDAYRWDTLERCWSMAYSENESKKNSEISSGESQALAQMSLEHKTTTKQMVKKALITFDSRYILVYTTEYIHSQGSTNNLNIIPLAALQENSEKGLQHPRPDHLTAPPDVVSHMLMPLGIIQGRRLVFIDRDLWLCSYPLGKSFCSTTGAIYNRFYFIPRNWVTQDSLKQCVLAEDGTLFWPKGDRVVLIECNLDETRMNSAF
ncbi:hypothetical protein F4782DRAFT_521079 [Xylaria castorea]|nr:hypothetical protein F4782DRAFT_521079 [Xylaria castorea]